MKVKITIWNNYDCENPYSFFECGNGVILSLQKKGFETENIKICLN